MYSELVTIIVFAIVLLSMHSALEHINVLGKCLMAIRTELTP